MLWSLTITLHASPNKHLKLFVIIWETVVDSVVVVVVVACVTSDSGAGTALDLSWATSWDRAVHVNTPTIADDTRQWPLSSKMKMVSSYQGKLPIRAWNHPSEETCTGNWDGTQTSKTWWNIFAQKHAQTIFPERRSVLGCLHLSDQTYRNCTFFPWERRQETEQAKWLICVSLIFW